ncbi:septum formation protein [Umboniibacter marinipuniceus]|uniref:dTTP/UTP pyrophosphatase n=2 Tax=Umboniibacter marinipuniceus TaxID=569599 RepID=A0A3M0A4Z4_9GAMM|nr:septum formation protein [Umboniibacter marinipuniceus]
MTKSNLFLASASPRRRELLALLGIPFEVVSNDIVERQAKGESAYAYVERLAREKAEAGIQGRSGVVIGSDTLGVLDGVVLEKPRDKEDALRMWRAMSGRSHEILTAVAVTDGTSTESRVVLTEVFFRRLSESEMAYYWTTGEPQDKAGAYAIQGVGGAFVERINGSYHAVVGLPLVETAELLSIYGIRVLNSDE